MKPKQSNEEKISNIGNQKRFKSIAETDGDNIELNIQENQNGRFKKVVTISDYSKQIGRKDDKKELFDNLVLETNKALSFNDKHVTGVDMKKKAGRTHLVSGIFIH